MIHHKLKELDALQNQKVEIILENNHKMKCIPKHFIEPEDEEFTYLVETYETYGGYPKDQLVELSAQQIKEIKPL